LRGYDLPGENIPPLDESKLTGLDTDYRRTFRDFYCLMKWKVTKVLLVSSLDDAFTME
jgi:hypothetical protein